MTTSTRRTALVRTSSGGQITIPEAFFEALGAEEGELLRVVLEDDKLTIMRDRDAPNQGSPGLRKLYDHFAPVREEILKSGISQEELFADIDAAVAEVRLENRKSP